MAHVKKTLVQCDFDGTVTVGDISFMLLDAFAAGDWRQWLAQYQAGRISAGRFNSEVFSMVTADKRTLLEYIKGRVMIRPGFDELVAHCHSHDFRLVIVSNGLRFYILQILEHVGVPDIEVYAARTQFCSDGLRVEHVGPDGTILDTGFKDAYTHSFLANGYRVIYIGDGRSDFAPARQCHHVFAAVASGSLLARCQQENIECQPFTDFHEVVRVMGTL